MLSFQILFLAVLGITLASGGGAVALVVFGDARRNEGHRLVAVRLAHIALVGTAALASLMTRFAAGLW